MSELNIPESWAESELKDIVDVMRNGFSCKQTKDGVGYPVSRIETVWNWGIDFQRVGYADIPQDKIDKYKLRRGDILFSHIHGYEYIGKSGLFDCEETLYHGMNSLLIRLVDGGVNPYFFFYYLKSEKIRNYWKSICKKAINQVSLNTQNVNSLIVPIPPGKEQERIVQKIETCFSKIEETEQNINKVEILLEKYRESLLAKAFRGELIPQNPDDEPASVLLGKIREERAQNQKGKKKEQEFAEISDDEKPFEIPESWEWVRLGEILDVKSGFAFRSQDMHKQGKVQVVKISNISIDGYVEKDNEYVESFFLNENAEYIIEYGDLLFALTRPVIQNVFKTGFYLKNEPALLNQRVAVAKGNKDVLGWVYSLTRTKYFIDEVIKRCTGANQPNLSHKSLELIPIPMPSQKNISDVLKKIEISTDKIKKLTNNISLKTLYLTRLRDGILSNAFEGRLVEQIDSEGTGQELLQKILEQKGQEMSAKENSKKKVAKKVSKKKTTKK